MKEVQADLVAQENKTIGEPCWSPIMVEKSLRGLPSKIHVAGITYTISEEPFVELLGNKNLLGKCEYDESHIEILETMSDDRKNDVFVHELLHAIFNEAGYDDHDEDEINRVARVLYQVLKDNDFTFLRGN